MNLKEKLDILDSIDKMRLGSTMTFPWHTVAMVRAKIHADKRKIPPSLKRYKTKILPDGSLLVSCVELQKRVVKTTKSGFRVWDGKDQYFFKELYVGETFKFDSQKIRADEVAARCLDACYKFRFLRTDNRHWMVCIEGIVKKNNTKFALLEMEVGDQKTYLDVGENTGRLCGLISRIGKSRGWKFNITSSDKPYTKIYTRTA